MFWHKRVTDVLAFLTYPLNPIPRAEERARDPSLFDQPHGSMPPEWFCLVVKRACLRPFFLVEVLWKNS
jgi:hypothetical protein